ncbi:hypothetical protein V3C99_005945 [Haemonchus contortus]
MFQDYFLFVLYVYLTGSSPVSGAGVPGALNTQEISPEAQVLSGEALVKYLNENQKLFKAKLTPAYYAAKYKLMDLKFIKQNGKPVVVDDEKDNGDDIPESFDCRDKWPFCSSLFRIYDQANCGSCWAVSSAAAMSDRICIASNGSIQVLLSSTDILSCCGEVCGLGCRGGYTIKAWEYFAEKGVVTGGIYGSRDNCRPYPLHPCGYHANETYYGECYVSASTPKCRKRCLPGYKNSYAMDKRHAKKAYQLPNSVKDIQRDIMKYGPVVASFAVYDDFNLYESGIYKHTGGGEPHGGHAVKVIGWGTENGTDYWIIANSWNYDWGEKGYFRMIRGENDCLVESEMVGGLIDNDS